MTAYVLNQCRTPLYVERPPKFLIGTTTPRRYVIPIRTWFCRIMAFVMTITNIDLTVRYGANVLGMELTLLFGTTFLLYYSEIRGGKDRKAANPLKLFENGIEIYPSFSQRLRGFNGFIPIEDVNSIHVERRDSFQLVERGKMVRLSWAPLELRIKMKDGTEYLTGLKPPDEIMAMAQILKERLNVAVIDTGEGLGRVEPLVQG